MIIDQNEQGEIKGYGPEWACEEYGHIGHDYQECRECQRRYVAFLNKHSGRAVVTGDAA